MVQLLQEAYSAETEEEAIESARAALGLNPELIDAEILYKEYPYEDGFMLFAKLLMYFKKGEYVKAKRLLKKANDYNPIIIRYALNPKAISSKEIKEIEAINVYSLKSKAEAYFIVKQYRIILDMMPGILSFL